MVANVPESSTVATPSAAADHANLKDLFNKRLRICNRHAGWRVAKRPAKLASRLCRKAAVVRCGVMVDCPRCGAGIDPSALACPYCQTQTLYGRQQQERQQAHQYHAAQAQQSQQAAERQSRQQALTKRGQAAMFWSIAGTLACCFPAAIVGMVMGFNVKGAAKREGAIAPATSTVAVVLGCCSILMCVVFTALYINDSRTRDARIVTLQAQVEGARSREVIDQPLACALVELKLLQDGYLDKSGIMIAAFQCDGKLEQTKDTATLGDVHFRTGSKERHVVAGCLTHGARWSVKELRPDGACTPLPAAAPSTAAPPSDRR